MIAAGWEDGYGRRKTSAEDAVRVATRVLEEHGAYVAAIRPPTVAPGTSRLRLSLMATHTPEDIELVAEALIDSVRAVCR